MSTQVAIVAAAIAAASGVPGLLLRRDSMLGQYVACFLACLASAASLFGIVRFWQTGAADAIRWSWPVPGGEFLAGFDGLTALFLAPVAVVFALGSIYGLGYWKQVEHTGNGRKLRLFYGLLAAGMTLVLVARNAIVFLFGWETMALSAFFLVATEDDDAVVRETSWLYLVATHLATLGLVALFSLMFAATGTHAFVPIAQAGVGPGVMIAMFALALFGFGLKAGLMPLHVWLPSSHAIAPSHVSAIMSGVILKMGVYGLVRFTSLVESPPLEWGAIVLGLGIVSGVLGVAFAIGQHDLKRLLAYHSIENIGIIAIGLGLALLGRSLGRHDWIVLGLAGGLLHVWNHALFKSLLFLAAGSVIHATHTRDIDHLGGLAKTMPITAFCFLVGAVAICGLPPLNGFVSEWLIYLGLFHAAVADADATSTAVALAAPALALVGALAVACFVKVFGAVFLGSGRTPHVDHAREGGAAVVAPMLALTACCAAIGMAPQWCAPVLDGAIAAWAPGSFAESSPSVASVAPLSTVSVMALSLAAALAMLWYAFHGRLRRTAVSRAATWGCGFARPTARMQYTSSSFAQMLVRLFDIVLRPAEAAPRIAGPFPPATKYHGDVGDTTLDRVVRPLFRAGGWLCGQLRFLQRGRIQANVLYIVLALVALLLCR